MPKLPESILALFAGRERAAAMYGDMTEMAMTRGRGWLAETYARTLVSLTWRLVLALFVADVGRELIFNLFHLYIRVSPASWRTSGTPHLLNHTGPLLACMISTLWFALPFAAVRYGLRDRFVKLTLAVALGTTVAFLFIPVASLVSGAAVLVLAGAAFASNKWRKPMEVLGLTGAVGVAALAAFTGLGRQFLQQHPGMESRAASHAQLTGYVVVLGFQASLLLIAVVCSRLHHRFLDHATVV